MRRPILAIAALLAMSIPAIADPADCARIDADLDRLACYDREIGRTPETKIETTGHWRVQVDKSKFDDSSNVFVAASSDDGVSCRFGKSEKIRLVVRCMENTTAIMVQTSCHLADHGGYGTVEFRVDDEKTRKISMDASTDNSTLGLWKGGSAIPLIKRLFGHDRLLVRFTPFSESPVTASFEIAGLEKASEPLRKACRW